ncbi:ATP-binding protein [uncultured Jatrophihabitans sp.]|uniref:ATP-binding protein n=1 Tax=uncultured Jatrophihabitans sp. TaxID=1610747 RepID=UPI0035C974B4
MGELAVRHEAASAGVVRSAIAADLTRRSIAPDTVDDVLLVASELVGNAVVHTGPTWDGDVASELDVFWDVTSDAVVVQVLDSSADAPRPRVASNTSTSGRGLAIVAALADAWGVEPAGEGKQVWARVPLAC